jgi:hypothetical protein
LKELRDGEPCSHKGCLSHISHPCEGCGRVAGKNIKPISEEETTHNELDKLIDVIANLKSPTRQ